MARVEPRPTVLPDDVDPLLWFTTAGCAGEHYLVDSPTSDGVSRDYADPARLERAATLSNCGRALTG